jgi:hypothetical protein
MEALRWRKCVWCVTVMWMGFIGGEIYGLMNNDVFSVSLYFWKSTMGVMSWSVWYVRRCFGRWICFHLRLRWDMRLRVDRWRGCGGGPIVFWLECLKGGKWFSMLAIGGSITEMPRIKNCDMHLIYFFSFN